MSKYTTELRFICETLAGLKESVGYADKFKVTVCGDEVTKGKPDPEPFLKAAQKLGADPETCIVFEDSPLGIRAAHTAGMKAVGIFDLVEFSDEIKSLMYAELEDLSEAIALVEGYTENEKFHEQKHIAIVTKSGTVIDLYNSTCLSGESVIKSITFANDYNIKIKTVKTIEELK